MTSPLFADARTSFEEARIVLFGVPFDATSTFRKGSSQAPKEIREESYNFETYIPRQDVDLDDVLFQDAGDVDCSGDIGDILTRVSDLSKSILDAGKTLIAIGGEHSLTPAVVKSFEDVGVIVLDAHLDFRDSYENERNSHACVTRRLSEIVGVDHVVPVGVRSYSKDEVDAAKTLGLSYVGADEILDSPLMLNISRKALSLVEKERIYLSVDMDVIDPAYAPGVGNPEAFGLAPSHVRDFIDLLGNRIVGMDFTEVSPPHDHGTTSLLAAQLIRESIAVLEKAQT